jgi:hypothetical protein
MLNYLFFEEKRERKKNKKVLLSIQYRLEKSEARKKKLHLLS